MGKSDKKNLTPPDGTPLPRGRGDGGEVLPRTKSLDPRLLTAARELRKKQTATEQILWMCLRNRRLGGIKFKRQHPLEKFVADFYCHEAGLVIELDGALHLEKDQAERDKVRTEVINSLGINVLRFTNAQIKTELEMCLNSIMEHARSLVDSRSDSGRDMETSPLTPLPRGRGE